MSRWGRISRVLAGTAAAGLLLAGCGSDTDGDPSASADTATSTMLPPAPTAFDPCSSAMQPILDSEELHGQNKADSDGNAGTQWRGCGWVQSDGYATSIRTTNITLPMIRENAEWKIAEELTIGGRAAVTYHDIEATDIQHDCLLNLELKGGSLQFSIDNPASRRKTGDTDSCEIAKRLADKVVSVIPASA